MAVSADASWPRRPDDLPAWMRIGTARYKVYYQLVCLDPVIYRGDRCAEGSSTSDVLWLFKRDTLWVAAHAPYHASMLDVVITTNLVFATSNNIVLEGYHEWDRVDCSQLVNEEREALLIGIGRLCTELVAPEGFQ